MNQTIMIHKIQTCNGTSHIKSYNLVLTLPTILPVKANQRFYQF